MISMIGLWIAVALFIFLNIKLSERDFLKEWEVYPGQLHAMGLKPFLFLIAEVVVVKWLDIAVTLVGYSNGFGWAEANGVLNVLETSPEWSVWYIPSVLVGYGATPMAVLAAFAVIPDFMCWPKLRNLAATGLYWFMGFHLMMPMATWTLFYMRDGVTLGLW